MSVSTIELMPGSAETDNSPRTYELEPDQTFRVPPGSQVMSKDETLSSFDLDGTVIAEIEAGPKKFFLVDAANDRSVSSKYVLIDDTHTSSSSETGFKGIWPNKPEVFGRDHHKDRFSYPKTVSRDHFEVSLDEDELFIHNLYPLNRTFVTVTEPSEYDVRGPELEVEDGRTVAIEERMKDHPHFGERDETAPYGYYLNHPVIGRNSKRVADGVYLGGSKREAIVVDSRSKLLVQVYKGFVTEMRNKISNQDTLTVPAILRQVMNYVQDIMPYNDRKTSVISEPYMGDQLVGLSLFVKEGTGVCRHQALFAAYILENLISEGILDGFIGVERNTVPDMGGTHAWAVYKTGKTTIVVDPAQTFVGTKEQARSKGRWEYYLSTD